MVSESTASPFEGSGGKEPFRLGIFQTLDEAQACHGVAHQDYANYRRFCTAKLSRLRHRQAVRSTMVHNHRYVEGLSGKRRHAYCPREIPDAIEHENVLLHLLYQSERAWAQACALQQQQSQQQQATTPPKSQHSYIARRLQKAAKWAAELEEKSRTSCVEETQLECQSYAAWMSGNVALEHKKYATAFRSYKKSMTLLLQLAENLLSSSAAASPSSASSPEILALGDLWSTRAETLLRPLVRFCGYEARNEIETDELRETVLSGDSASSAAAATGGSDSSILLSFRGKQIALDSYKQLAVLYLKMEGVLSQPTGGMDEQKFLQLLSDLDDALQLIKAEASHYENLPKAGPAITAKRDELQALSGFFQYQKLSVWRRHQERLIQDLVEDAEILHVYDTLQRNAEAMAEIPATTASGSTKDLEEDPFWLEAQAHVIRIRAFRCYYLAKLYESESSLNGTPEQVMALLRQSLKLAKRAQEEIAAFDDDTAMNMDAEASLSALEDLTSKIDAMICRAEATRFLTNSGTGGGSSLKTDRPLWLRLDDFDTGAVLADNPPLPIPMPCKPSFFDLAWQHIDTDNTSSLDTIQEYIASKEPAKTGGFLSSWFG